MKYAHGYYMNCKEEFMLRSKGIYILVYIKKGFLSERNNSASVPIKGQK